MTSSQLQEKFMEYLDMSIVGTDVSLEHFKSIIDNPNFDVNAKIDGKQPIFWAAYESRLDVLDYLIEKGADINVLTSIKSNVLLYILNNGTEMLHDGSVELANKFFRTANYLIDKGININYINPNDHETALDIAIKHNLIDVINHLLEKNVEMTQKERKKVNELLGIPNERTTEPSSEENVSEGDIRQIMELTTKTARDRDYNSLSPRYTQEQYRLCWAFSMGRVFFKYIFKGVQIGYLHSNINLGKHYYKKNNFSEYFSSISNIKKLNNTLTSTDIKYLFSGSSTDTQKIFKKPTRLTHINYDAEPTFIRQSVILFYLIIFFSGTRCNFNTDRRIYDVSEYSGNFIKIINSFIKFILDRKTDYTNAIRNIGIEERIYEFFIHFGYSKELVDYITIFFIKLGLKLFYGRSLLPDNKPTNLNKRFLFFFKENITNIDEIKLLFRDAKQQGLYLIMTFSNVRKLLEIPFAQTHITHAMYAIPVDNEKFILKNSWNDKNTDKIIYFRDLLNYESTINIHYLYFNYNNQEQKTRRIPSFQRKPRKTLRPFPIERINSQILAENKRPSLTRRKSLNLSASKTRKINRIRSSLLEQRHRLRPSLTRRHSYE